MDKEVLLAIKAMLHDIQEGKVSIDDCLTEVLIKLRELE